MIDIHNKWFSISLENPFKTWYKALKYFKFPDIKFNWYVYSPERWGKIINIECWDLMWKMKWGTSRHEENPHLRITLFNSITFNWELTKRYRNEFREKENGDSEYWEYILDYLYVFKNLKCYGACFRDSQLYKYRKSYGNKEDGTEDVYEKFPFVIPTVSMSLNKKGIKQLKKELNESRTNNKCDQEPCE